VVIRHNEQRGVKAAAKAPISTHPAFPALVGLWFAALFGIGSVVVPAVLLERLVAITGIAHIISAAQPPLGVTARIIIALLASGGGALLGLTLARHIARAKPSQAHVSAPVEAALAAPLAFPVAVDDAPSASPSPSSAKKPISAHEELSADGFDQLIAEDSFAAHFSAGQDSEIKIADECGAGAGSTAAAPAAAPPYKAAQTADHEETPQSHAADHANVEGAPHRAADILIAAPLADLGMVELVERFALSLQKLAPAPETAQCPDQNPDQRDRDNAAEYAGNADSFHHETGENLTPENHGSENQDGGFGSLLAMDIAMGSAPEFVPGSIMNNGQNSGSENIQTEEQVGAPAEDTAQEGTAQSVITFPTQADRHNIPPANGPAQEQMAAAHRADDSKTMPAGEPSAPARHNQADSELALRDALSKLQKMSGAA